MTTPVKDALQALSRHADLIGQAMEGTIDANTGTPAIAALRQVSAIRPAGEDGYRLHPHLREYLQDHLQLYPGFQSLSDIGTRISLMNTFWNEIDNVRRVADSEAIAELLDQLHNTVFDIIDSMERNMLLLQTLMSTRYGNVKTLEAKKSQNRFYQQQTTMLTADLSRLSRVADKIERDATVRGMEDLARFLRRNLQHRVMPWQQGMSEIETLISREIFRTREVERNHRQLVRMDMLLRQQPAWKGIEADLSGVIPDFLLATRLPKLRPQLEPLDTDRDMRLELEEMVRAMPALKAETPTDALPRRYTRQQPVQEPPKPRPESLALEKLVQHVRNSQESTNLLSWRLDDSDAMFMEPGVWLVFAIQGLRARHMQVSLVQGQPRPGERFVHVFVDAIAHCQQRRVA